MICYYAIAIIYTICRKKYVMKKNGTDIFKAMAEPYAPWHEMEAAAKAKYTAKEE